MFTNLEKVTLFEVRVMARNKIGFGWPSRNFTKTGNADRPDTPTISNTETAVPGCNVTLKWTKPPSNGCPILFYTVHYRRKTVGRDADGWSTINVTDPKMTQQELFLNCTTFYQFEVQAWNALGSSGPPSKAWPITTGKGQQQSDYSEGTARSGSFLNSDLKFVVVVACLAFIAVPLIIIARYCKPNPTSSHRVKRTIDDIQVLEHCEISPTRTTFVEELGEGAFGKVHKAILENGLEFFKSQQDCSRRKREQLVAVKELHDNPTDEQRSEFLAEIELMKKIGQHPNVLSFLGCWTTTKPLLLVIEYVPHGDLRRWLISKRRKVKSYRSDCQNNYN